MELAFVSALQQLPPRQAATLVLRDVLGYSAAEVATMLDTTQTAIKGTLQRARASVDQARRTAESMHAPPAAGSAQERTVSRRFAEAFTANDVDGVVALLADHARLTMPPAPHEYHGVAAIAAFLRAAASWRRGRHLRLVSTRANNQPAFGCYLTGVADAIAHPAGLIVLTLEDNQIRAITRFHDNDLHRRFGLPSALPARSRPASSRDQS